MKAALRRFVIERAGDCCEYCRLPQQDDDFSFHIDHIIAEKHGGETVEENLCLSCYTCNSYKGSDIASIDRTTGIMTALFHPRQHIWEEHFHLEDTLIQPLTPEGRVPVTLLRLNSPQRLAERTLLIALARYRCSPSST